MKIKPRNPVQSKQTAIALLLTLALLIVQFAGLHFHIHQLAASSVSAVIHSAHVGEHTICHGDTCGTDGTDVSIAKARTSPIQDWNPLALLITVFALLLPAAGRVIGHIPPDQNTPFDHPVFLRPPLRAPPR